MTFFMKFWRSCLKHDIFSTFEMARLTYLTRNPTIYNIIRWFAGPMGQTTRQPSVWSIYFFIKSCNILCKNPFNLFFLNYKKNTWNIRRLVDKSFVPSAQRTSVLYCRLMDFTSWGNTVVLGTLNRKSKLPSWLAQTNRASFTGIYY